MEQPREPIFYPNEKTINIGMYSNTDEMIQSIDGTLKRIEAILHQMQSQSSALVGLVLSEQRSKENSTD